MNNALLKPPRNGGGLLLTGREAVKALSKVETRQSNQDLWPYPWHYSPPGASRRTPQGSIAAPAVGAPAEILAFTVPTNRTFVFTAVIVDMQAGAWVPGSGDYLFSITLDTPTSGTAPLTALTLADMRAMALPLGSVRPFSVCELWRPEFIKSGQTLRATVQNVSGGVGAPNFACAYFFGYLVNGEMDGL